MKKHNRLKVARMIIKQTHSPPVPLGGLFFIRAGVRHFFGGTTSD